MNYQGIIPGRPFPVSRLLTERDYKYRLQQNERLNDVTPYSDLSVIKLNSTYLEIVDKYYGWKGWAAFMFNTMALFIFGGSIWCFILSLSKLNKGDSYGFYFLLVCSAILTFFVLLVGFLVDLNGPISRITQFA